MNDYYEWKQARRRVLYSKIYNPNVYDILIRKPNNAKWNAVYKFLLTHDS